MGDFEEWSDYNFMWTQWKSNKIIEGLKTYKEVLKENEDTKSSEQNLSSTQVTGDDNNSSNENLITTPKRSLTKSQALHKQEN